MGPVVATALSAITMSSAPAIQNMSKPRNASSDGNRVGGLMAGGAILEDADSGAEAVVGMADESKSCAVYL